MEMENCEIVRNGSLYKCNICEKEFRQKSNLNTHFKGVHEKSKNQTCNICNASFRDLNSHIRYIHHKENITKVFCELCHKKITKSLLNKHLERVHNKNKKCEFCDKSFSLNANLTQHMLTCYNDNKCDLCDETFFKKGHVKKHISTVHGHKCNICGKSFTREDSLKRHNHNFYK